MIAYRLIQLMHITLVDWKNSILFCPHACGKSAFPLFSPGNLGAIPHWGLWYVYSYLECNASYFSNILVIQYHVGASLSVHTIKQNLKYKCVCQCSINLLEDKGLQHLLFFPRNRRTFRWMMYSVTVNLHLCWCLAHYMMGTCLG